MSASFELNKKSTTNRNLRSYKNHAKNSNTIITHDHYKYTGNNMLYTKDSYYNLIFNTSANVLVGTQNNVSQRKISYFERCVNLNCDNFLVAAYPGKDFISPHWAREINSSAPKLDNFDEICKWQESMIIDMLLELEQIEKFIELSKKSNTFFSLSKSGFNAQLTRNCYNFYPMLKNPYDRDNMINVTLNFGLTQYNYDPNIYVSSENKITNPLIAWQVCDEKLLYNSSNFLISEEQVILAKSSNIERNQKILSLGFHSDKLGYLGINHKTPYVYFGINDLTYSQNNTPNLHVMSPGASKDLVNSSVTLNHRGIAATSGYFYLESRTDPQLDSPYGLANNHILKNGYYSTTNTMSFFGIRKYDDRNFGHDKKSFDTGLKITTHSSNPSIGVVIKNNYIINVARKTSLQHQAIILNKYCFKIKGFSVFRNTQVTDVMRVQMKQQKYYSTYFYYKALINSKISILQRFHETV